MQEKYIVENAKALFLRFARRHGLSYDIVGNEPMEILWAFPAQDKLALPITIGLQNRDALNFGVSDFWSHFYPFEAAAGPFESLLDSWVVGDARIAVTGPMGRVLQLWGEGRWTSIYRANRFLPFSGKPKRTIENRPVIRTD